MKRLAWLSIALIVASLLISLTRSTEAANQDQSAGGTALTKNYRAATFTCW